MAKNTKQRNHNITKNFMSDLKLLVYTNDSQFGNKYITLPGFRFEQFLQKSTDLPVGSKWLESKLLTSCRKLCLMWTAGDNAVNAEQEFYAATFHETPALFGEDAINVHYHLEALILFARSSLDIAAGLFGFSLPAPFPKGKFDSFNKLVKTIIKSLPDAEISFAFKNMQKDQKSWFSILCGTEKGRSLRDKIVHQTEFPIDYTELNPPSEKERAIVRINRSEFLPLQEFINIVRNGVVANYLKFEELCTQKGKKVRS